MKIGSTSGVVSSLLQVKKPEDIMPDLDELIQNGDRETLRKLYKSASDIQTAIRQVESSHGCKYWLMLRCWCSNRVRWSIGPTMCHGGSCQHKVSIKRVKCTLCNKSWELNTMDHQAAAQSGLWHPYNDKHCINPQCSHYRGMQAYKVATCPSASARGPVKLR